jgi:hypothetical protein
MWTRSFEDEAEDRDEETGREAAAADEPEYAFDGYEIEFSQRIVLTAVQPPRGGGASGDR